MKRIILTGGGTAGHVTPNIALIPKLRELGFDIHYIGSYNGIEKDLIEPFGIPYHGISSGKLRRYFSLQNFTDPFRVIKGFGEARKLIKNLKPDVIFSKGGFVSVPVVLAGKKCKVPVIIHESDMTPGLANKIAIPSAAKICCNFPETLDCLPEGKAVLTGSPIRQELLSGNKIAAMDLCKFTADKPVILVIGGSLGSVVVNNAVRESLPCLLKDFQIIHLCGKGKTDESLKNTKGYCQFEYVKDELRDIFALSEIVISSCLRCRRIDCAVPRYRQGTFVHNRPARKVRRHGNTVALHVQDNILVFRNGDDLLRRHPGDITCQCNRSFFTI